MAKKRDVTIQDIARQANVGVGTVSRVLNHSPNVNPETQQRVQQLIADLGYRPNTAAVALRTRRTREIGFITDEIASTPFAVDVIRGAQDAAWEHNKLLVLINTNRNPQALLSAIETMLERQVEGVIYAAMYHQQVKLPATIHEVPTVLVDCFHEDQSLPSVVPDEVQGGRVATEALLKQGHRRIGFISNVDPIPAMFGRLEGHRQALAANDVDFEPDLITNVVTDAAQGYDGAMRLLLRPNRPTALFCFNDRVAMGAYDALRDLGLAVPRDVAVIGFDNQELIAAHLRPPLTTMQLPHYAMGRWAVSYLVEHTEGPSVDAPQLKLECPLVWRASV